MIKGVALGHEATKRPEGLPKLLVRRDLARQHAVLYELMRRSCKVFLGDPHAHLAATSLSQAFTLCFLTLDCQKNADWTKNRKPSCTLYLSQEGQGASSPPHRCRRRYLTDDEFFFFSLHLLMLAKVTFSFHETNSTSQEESHWVWCHGGTSHGVCRISAGRLSRTSYLGQGV